MLCTFLYISETNRKLSKQGQRPSKAFRQKSSLKQPSKGKDESRSSLSDTCSYTLLLLWWVIPLGPAKTSADITNNLAGASQKVIVAL